MRLKILMVVDKEDKIHPDAEMLKERGMLVYTCSDAIAEDMVEELVPDVVLINPEVPNAGITKAYHKLLRNKFHFKMPVIYTLAEDEQYLINIRSRANKIVKLVADNIVDGIRKSLHVLSTQQSFAHNKVEKYPANFA